ncbi:MAG: peptide chain release factor N(5)-glutamine methyltransferase [Chloroflexota bacterium]
MTTRPSEERAWPQGCSARTAQAGGRRQLESAGIGEAPMEAGLLLGHVLRLDRIGLLMRGSSALSALEAAEFRALVARRSRREPLAYLVGFRNWLDFNINVDRNVLIPRPETEILAGLAIEATRQAGSARARTPRVVDVGTGSGALAIAVARACPEANLLAIETGAGAIRTARENCRRLAPDRVILREGDLLPADLTVDILVANLPYIPTAELRGLEPDLAYEPRLALDGGPDGLRLIEALLDQAGGSLASGGVVLLECHYDQGTRVVEMAKARFPGSVMSLHGDLAGTMRFVRVEAPLY